MRTAVGADLGSGLVGHFANVLVVVFYLYEIMRGDENEVCGGTG